MADEIADWLEQLGLGKYSQQFIDNEVDLDAARDLTEDDLKDLGLPLGPRKKLLRAIVQIPEQPDEADEHPAAVEVDSTDHAGDAERRHLTVMFCDLVGSTEHATTLDPEDMHALLSAFQETCGRIASEHGGHVAKLLGDGLLIYFGYPKAHEDDGEQAVRSALQIVEAVQQIETPDQHPLQSRVGIASGVVVIGEILSGGGGDLAAVSGSVPHLAARLESAASPNSVLISQSTRQLVGQLFELEQKDALDLKGFDEQVSAFVVRGAAEVESRFAATRNTSGHAFVGRKNELGLLHDSWMAAIESEGQAVLVSGEAGIGKSRLLAEFCESISDFPHTRLNYQCSPQHTDAPLYPVIMQLRRAAGIRGGEEPSDQADKLEALIGHGTSEVDRDAPLFAHMLGISDVQRYGNQRYAPETFKELAFDALGAQLRELSIDRPVLVLFEDLHWADPMTQELLAFLIARNREQRVMVLATTRPETLPAWLELSHTTQLNLRRLRRANAREIAQETAGAKLPSQVLDEILSKADGNPLFVEEITKALVETGSLEQKGSEAGSGPVGVSGVPSTLHDSLIARLDRFSAEKDVAQFAAVLGRTFQVEVLAAASGQSLQSVRDALKALEKAAIVYRQPGALTETFEFKHALIRDAAYDSLTRSSRINSHFSVAVCLEEQFPEIARLDSGLLAQHFVLGGQPNRSLVHWLQAGRAAYSHSAVAEAAQYLRRGLGIIQEVRSGSSHDEMEISFQAALGVTLTSLEGYAAEATTAAYERAHSLLPATSDVQLKERVLAGLCNSYINRAEFRRCRPIADEKLAIAETSNDGLLLSSAHRTLANLNNLGGNFPAALEHGYQSYKNFDVRLHESSHRTAAHHDGVGALVHYSTPLWHVGRVRESDRRMKQALDLARSTDHPNTMCYAFGWLGFIGNFIRHEFDAVVEAAKESLQLAEMHDLPQPAAIANCWKALESLSNEEYSTALHCLRENRDVLLQKNVSWQLPYYSTIEAQIQYQMGEPEVAIGTMGDALDMADNTGEVCYAAEIHRLMGDVYLTDLNDSERGLELIAKSIETAAEQGSKMFELRAVASLVNAMGDAKHPFDAVERIETLLSEIDADETAWDIRRARRCLEASKDVPPS